MNNQELIEKFNYDPTRIGIEILKQQGYYVKTFNYSDSIYVYENDKQKKVLYTNQ